MKRERKITELIKPITSTITKEIEAKKQTATEPSPFRSARKTEPSPFKPTRLYTSTPKGILRNYYNKRIKSASKRNNTDDFSDAESYHTIIDDDVNDSKTDAKPKSSTKSSVRKSKSKSVSPSSSLNVRPLISKLTPIPSRRISVGAREINSLRRDSKYIISKDDSDEIDEEGKTSRRKRKTRTKTGDGIKTNAKSIDFDFIPYNVNDRIVYEYFNDANQLCDRLKLLLASKRAGNSNHIPEINSIITELRVLGCIA